MITVDDVRLLALALPRAYEVLVRDRIKFRVGRIVWLAFSRDERLMGLAFPKVERDSLIAGDPIKFQLPQPSDLRYNWVVADTAVLKASELPDLVFDAWALAVPKRVVADQLAAQTVSTRRDKPEP